ncbi:MAG: DUF1566 domain-containing protein [Proteobacteria bacterium]|nr:DUF1566 domain-containing protein [Pseudomonadota bacterium]
MTTPVFATDQILCFDETGPAPCPDLGQDGEVRAGPPWPLPRFELRDLVARDLLTGLSWPKDASFFEFPASFPEALDLVEGMNRQGGLGHSDWRLPARRELFSLVSHARINPCLPRGHPFTSVFSSYHWTSESVARLPDQAWYVHLGGARVFKGMKQASYMVWPVRGQSAVIPAGTGAGGPGALWPEPRFEARGNEVADRLTGLAWTACADLAQGPVSWTEALALCRGLDPPGAWRLPNIRELESLTDLSAHTPALALGHPFINPGKGYWSSTTSAYDPAYAWTLYTDDGIMGVGYKKNPEFLAWAVRGNENRPGGQG